MSRLISTVEFLVSVTKELNLFKDDELKDIVKSSIDVNISSLVVAETSDLHKLITDEESFYISKFDKNCQRLSLSYI